MGGALAYFLAVFNLFRKKPTPPAAHSLYDLLFGDAPFNQWLSAAPNAGEAEPWASFQHAQAALTAGHPAVAIARLEQVLTQPQLESRQVLQAWHWLRELGVGPPEAEAKRVYGVVVEMGLLAGVDVIAGYADHSARYLNHGGSAIVWEGGDQQVVPLIHDAIDDLLEVGSDVVAVIGPWAEARRPMVRRTYARINFLTPSGLHFGEGPSNDLERDPMAGPVIGAAFRLMQALMEQTRK